jgi:transposase
MWIDYGAAIAESAAELAVCERTARGCRSADRVKLLRLLKSGQERRLRRAAAVLGYTERQGQRGWRACRAGGLAGLLAVRRPGGLRERITPAALAGLEGEMRAGRIARRREAQAYLREQWGLPYSLDGLCGLFQRHKIKRKTGRPRHRRADAAAPAAFKKAVRGGA